MSEQSTPEQILADVQLFRGLSNRQLKRLLKVARETDHRPGSVVAEEGHGAAAFHVLLSGHAEVSVGGQPKRTLGPGDYFGEISLLDGKPRSAKVRVSDDGPMRTLAILNTDFNNLLEDDPGFARALLVQLCTRLRAAEQGG